MSVMMAVFDLISPPLPEQKSVSKFQQLLITFMHLRLNLSVQDLAYQFGVHASQKESHKRKATTVSVRY